MTTSSDGRSSHARSLWARVKMAVKDPEWVLQQVRVRHLLGGRRSRGNALKKFPPYHRLRQAAPVVDPSSVAASAASDISDDDPVVGLAEGGEQRAYPWWIADSVHVVNDRLGGRPVVLITCGKCRSAVALDPVVDGHRLIFSATHFYAEAIAVTDARTKSVWAPFLGEAIRGALKGRRLELLPAWQTSWSHWRERHPSTTVMTPPPSEAPQWPGGGLPQGKRSPWWAERVPSHELVVGVAAPGGSRAYRIADLRAVGGVVNDDIAGTPVVVLASADDAVGSAAAFSRRVRGRTLTFHPAGDAITDGETGSVWTVEGRAVGGPLAGEALTFIPSHVATGRAWAAQAPGIELSS